MAAVGYVLSCKPPPSLSLESRKFGLETDLTADLARKFWPKPSNLVWWLWAALAWLLREVVVFTIPGGDSEEMWH